MDDEKVITSNVKAAKKFLVKEGEVESPSTAQVHNEVKQRLKVMNAYKISGNSKELNKKITEVRSDEEKFVDESEDKSGARRVVRAQRKKAAESNRSSMSRVEKAKLEREILTDYSIEEMQDEDVMNKARKHFDKKLKKTNDVFEAVPSLRSQIINEAVSTSREMVGLPQDNDI